jgi:hypothetical protein
MRENLRAPAHVQRDEWSGTLAADEVDLKALEEFIGVDPDLWRLVVVDIYIGGGSQSIAGYAVPQSLGSYESLHDAVRDTGCIEVTRVAEWDENPADHIDTNPPAPPIVPLTWASELIALGFKRLHLRMIKLPNDLHHDGFEIIEVASIVDQDEQQ